MLFVTNPKYEKQKVEKTKKRIFVNKKNKRNIKEHFIDKQNEINQNELTNALSDVLIHKYNNDTYILKLSSKNIERYKIRENIKKEFNMDIPHRDIRQIIEESKESRRGNHKFCPTIPNQNGKIRPNTEVYHEIF